MYSFYSNLNVYYENQKLWYKNLSIIENLKINNSIKENNLIIFEDNTTFPNYYYGHFSIPPHYEYSGFLKMAFSNQTRFGIDIYQINNIDNINDNFFRLPIYNSMHYIDNNKYIRININNGILSVNKKNILYLWFLEFTNQELFYKYIKNLIFLEEI